MTDLESSFVHENPKPETKPPTTTTTCTNSYVDGLRKAKQIVEDLLKQEESDFPDCGWMRTDKGSVVPLRSEYVEGGIETLRDVLDCLEEEIDRTERKFGDT